MSLEIQDPPSPNLEQEPQSVLQQSGLLPQESFVDAESAKEAAEESDDVEIVEPKKKKNETSEEDDREINYKSDGEEKEEDESETESSLELSLSESSGFVPSEDDDKLRKKEIAEEEKLEKEADEDSLDLRIPSYENQAHFKRKQEEKRKRREERKRKREGRSSAEDGTASEADEEEGSESSSDEFAIASEDFVVSEDEEDEYKDSPKKNRKAKKAKSTPGAPKKKPKKKANRKLVLDNESASDPEKDDEDSDSEGLAWEALEQNGPRIRNKPDRFHAGVTDEEEKAALKHADGVDIPGDGRNGEGAAINLRSALHDMIFDGLDADASKYMQDHFWSSIYFGNNSGSKRMHLELAKSEDCTLQRFAHTSYETVCALCQTTKPCFGVIKTPLPFFIASGATHDVDDDHWVNSASIDPKKLEQDRVMARNFPKVGIVCAGKFRFYKLVAEKWRTLCYQAIYYRQMLRGGNAEGEVAEQVALDVKAAAIELEQLEMLRGNMDGFVRLHLPEWREMADEYNSKKNATNAKKRKEVVP